MVPDLQHVANTPTPWDYRAWYYFTMRDNYSMSDPLFTCPLARIANYQTYAGWTWAGDPRGNYRGVGQGEFYIWIQRTGWGTYPNASVAGPSRTTDSTERMRNPILAEAAMAQDFAGSLADHPGTIYAADESYLAVTSLRYHAITVSGLAMLRPAIAVLPRHPHTAPASSAKSMSRSRPRQ